MSLRGVLWQNFLESIAQVLSRILTDEETEVIVNGVKSIESRLQAQVLFHRIESESEIEIVWIFFFLSLSYPLLLTWLLIHLYSIKSLKDDQLLKNVNRLCKHEGECLSHGTRGWIKSFLAGLVLKYAMDGIPMLVSGKLFNGNRYASRHPTWTCSALIHRMLFLSHLC